MGPQNSYLLLLAFAAWEGASVVGSERVYFKVDPISKYLSQDCPEFSTDEGGLLDLPLRASNEGLLRPRVARAQEINRPPSLSFLAGPSPHPMPVQISPHRTRLSLTF